MASRKPIVTPEQQAESDAFSELYKAVATYMDLHGWNVVEGVGPPKITKVRGRRMRYNVSIEVGARQRGRGAIQARS